jgi:hypothetical protein
MFLDGGWMDENAILTIAIKNLKDMIKLMELTVLAAYLLYVTKVGDFYY